MLSSDDMTFVDVETIQKTDLFTNEELDEIKKQRNSYEISLPPIATMTDWKMGDLKSKWITKLLYEAETIFAKNILLDEKFFGYILHGSAF